MVAENSKGGVKLPTVWLMRKSSHILYSCDVTRLSGLDRDRKGLITVVPFLRAIVTMVSEPVPLPSP